MRLSNPSPEASKTSGYKKLSVKCRFCKSANIVKKGFRQTEKRGKIQRFICRDCQRSFCHDDGFWRMRNKENIITMAIDMYLSSLSSRKMRNQLKRHIITKISHVSILDWVRRYILKIQRFIDTLKPKLSGRYYMDETTIVRDMMKDWLWCSVDWGTRFIPATHYSLFSDKTNCLKFLTKLKRHGIPRYIKTDSAPWYPNSIREIFGEEVEHRRNNVKETGKHNVRIETVFSKLKDRIKAFRGLKALWSAPILLNGLIIQHNFIEAHTTTGKIPCELTGLNLDLGENRWLGMIKFSAR